MGAEGARGEYLMSRVAAQGDALFWSVLDDSGQEVEVIAGYLRQVSARGFSPHTVRAYAYDMLAFWRWLTDAGKDVWCVTTEDLLRYIEWEKRRVNPQRPGTNVYRIEDGRAGGIAVTTINRRLAAIHGLYEHLMRQNPDRLPRNPVPREQVHRAWTMPPKGLLGHLRRNVTRNALRLRSPQRLPRGLTAAEVQRLVRSFRTFRDKAIALLMLYGGLRSSELLSLQMRDLDLAGGTVRVWGKGGRERIVPVDADALRLVHRYILYERPESEEPVVFLVAKGPHRGQPLTAEGLRRLFRYHRLRSGVLVGNPHRLRHTYATNLAQAGVDAHVLRDLMGHAHIESSLVYIHLTAHHLREEYDRALKRVKAGEGHDGE